MNQLELRAAFAVGLLYLVRMLGLFSILPVFVIAAEFMSGSSPFLLGLAMGIYGFFQSILQIPLGFLSDRVGRRKVIIGALCVFVVGSIVAAMADDIYGLILGRSLQGMGAIAGVLLALVSDLTRLEHRSKAMAIVGGCIGISFAVSMLVGPLLYAAGGLSGLFFLSAIAGLIGIGIVIYFIPKTGTTSFNLNSAPQGNQLGDVLRNQNLWALNFSIFATHYLLMSGFLAFPLLLTGAGVNLSQHAQYYLLILLGSFVAMLPFVYLYGRNNWSAPLLRASVLVISLALYLLSIDQNFTGLLLALGLFFFAFNFLEATLPVQLSNTVGAGFRGTAMGVYSSCQFAGIFAGGLMGGMLVSVQGFSFMLTVNSVVCLFWFVIMLKLRPQKNCESRVLEYTDSTGWSANEIVEQLSSTQGVEDVVIIPEHRTVYLKVDRSSFDDSKLADFAQRKL
jgi:MFS family permease